MSSRRTAFEDSDQDTQIPNETAKSKQATNKKATMPGSLDRLKREYKAAKAAVAARPYPPRRRRPGERSDSSSPEPLPQVPGAALRKLFQQRQGSPPNSDSSSPDETKYDTESEADISIRGLPTVRLDRDEVEDENDNAVYGSTTSSEVGSPLLSRDAKKQLQMGTPNEHSENSESAPDDQDQSSEDDHDATKQKELKNPAVQPSTKGVNSRIAEIQAKGMLNMIQNLTAAVPVPTRSKALTEAEAAVSTQPAKKTATTSVASTSTHRENTDKPKAAAASYVPAKIRRGANGRPIRAKPPTSPYVDSEADDELNAEAKSASDVDMKSLKDSRGKVTPSTTVITKKDEDTTDGTKAATEKPTKDQDKDAANGQSQAVAKTALNAVLRGRSRRGSPTTAATAKKTSKAQDENTADGERLAAVESVPDEVPRGQKGRPKKVSPAPATTEEREDDAIDGTTTSAPNSNSDQTSQDATKRRGRQKRGLPAVATKEADETREKVDVPAKNTSPPNAKSGEVAKQPRGRQTKVLTTAGANKARLDKEKDVPAEKMPATRGKAKNFLQVLAAEVEDKSEDNSEAPAAKSVKTTRGRQKKVSPARKPKAKKIDEKENVLSTKLSAQKQPTKGKPEKESDHQAPVSKAGNRRAPKAKGHTKQPRDQSDDDDDKNRGIPSSDESSSESEPDTDSSTDTSEEDNPDQVVQRTGGLATGRKGIKPTKTTTKLATAAKSKTIAQSEPRVIKPTKRSGIIEIICDAIIHTDDRKGASVQAIKKYMEVNNPDDNYNSGIYFKKAIASGMESGRLIRPKNDLSYGTSLRGRFLTGKGTNADKKDLTKLPTKGSKSGSAEKPAKSTTIKNKAKDKVSQKQRSGTTSGSPETKKSGKEKGETVAKRPSIRNKTAKSPRNTTIKPVTLAVKPLIHNNGRKGDAIKRSSLGEARPKKTVQKRKPKKD